MIETGTWERHLALYSAADALYRAGELKQARVLFLKALEIAPGDVDTRWALGSCLSELGRPYQAERYFRLARTRAAFAARGDLLYNIANALFDQGRFRAAIRLYRRVPRHAQAYPLARRNVLRCRRLLANPRIHPDRLRRASPASAVG